MATEQEKEEIRHLTQELKKVRNLEQLLALLKKSGADMKHGPYSLCGKRRGYHAYSFSDFPPNPAKTHYLFDDGASIGVCRYENLYRYLEFRV